MQQKETENPRVGDVECPQWRRDSRSDGRTSRLVSNAAGIMARYNEGGESAGNALYGLIKTVLEIINNSIILFHTFASARLQ